MLAAWATGPKNFVWVERVGKRTHCSLQFLVTADMCTARKTSVPVQQLSQSQATVGLLIMNRHAAVGAWSGFRSHHPPLGVQERDRLVISSDQQVSCFVDRSRQVDEPHIPFHRALAEAAIGLVFAKTALLH